MKKLLFLASIAGLICTVYCLATGFEGGCGSQDSLFFALLLILLFNSVVGLVLTYPKKKIKQQKEDNGTGNSH